MTESIKLYGFGDHDRSGKVRWLARELGLEVVEERVKLGDHYQDPYRTMNPLRQIPTVIFRDQTLIESTAACQIIAEAVDAPKLWIGPGEPRRDDYLFWISVTAETVEGRLVECNLSRAGILDAAYYELHSKGVRRKLKAIVAMLPEDGFVCGEFTLADIVVAYSLRLAVSADLVEWDAVEGYLRRLSERPAADAARFFGGIASALEEGGAPEL